jgi:hypothetical protein
MYTTDEALCYDRSWKQFGEEHYDNLEFGEDFALNYASLLLRTVYLVH